MTVFVTFACSMQTKWRVSDGQILRRPQPAPVVRCCVCIPDGFPSRYNRRTKKSKGQRAAACLVRFVLPTLPFCSRKRPLNCYCVDATSCGKCPQGNTVSRKRFFSPLFLPGCFSFFMLLLSRTNPMFLNVSSGLENEL